MRRYRSWLILLAVIGLALIVERYARHEDWQPLPDGGEIRLVTTTHETNARVRVGASILEPLRPRLGAAWLNFLGPPPLDRTFPSERPELVIWFTTRLVGNNHLPSCDHFVLLLGDEEIPASRCAVQRIFTSDGCRELEGVTFNVAPTAERRLRIRLVKGDRVIDQSLYFDADNTCYTGVGQPLSPAGPAPARLGFGLPYGQPVPERPGYVTSPFAPASDAIDVHHLPMHAVVRCPYTKKIFLVP